MRAWLPSYPASPAGRVPEASGALAPVRVGTSSPSRRDTTVVPWRSVRITGPCRSSSPMTEGCGWP
ncbi:hypothetical protein ACFFX0_05135 [Citricoccus parietis]|uniref:Uncharacterized protein n=1 Tax=Citricoccus parietis TaxID=592307 RepID=A0ABV5FV93_9MICC